MHLVPEQCCELELELGFVLSWRSTQHAAWNYSSRTGVSRRLIGHHRQGSHAGFTDVSTIATKVLTPPVLASPLSLNTGVDRSAETVRSRVSIQP